MMSRARSTYHSQALRRVYTQDFSVPRRGPAKTARIDLGLALLSRHAMPGVCYTQDEIALWCGCTNAAIAQIERVALLKLRHLIQFRSGDLGRQLAEAFFERRVAAVPKQGRFTS